jgi:sigma-B regulation protein RsbU (phosphoserine phosphatase)
MAGLSGPSSRDYAAYGALALLFAIAVTFQYRDVRERFERFYVREHARYPIDLGITGNRIEDVKPEAASHGLRAGDLLVSVNGRPFEGQSDLYVPLRRAKTGDVIVLGTRSPSSPSPAAEDTHNSIRLASALAPARSAADWLGFVTFNFGVPLVCILLGFFVVTVRVRDPQAWMLLLLLLGFVRQGSSTAAAFFGYDDFFQPIGLVYAQTIESLWPVGMALFGIYFGERLPIDRTYPWAKWILLGPGLVFTVAVTSVMYLNGHDWRTAAAAFAFLKKFDVVLSVLFFSTIALFFGGIGYKAMKATNRDARRRLRLLSLGACVSLSPILAVAAKSALTGDDGFAGLPAWFVAILLAMLFLFPVTLAYVIVVQKALDVRVVIRQSVQYLLASGSVRVLQIVLSVIVILAAAFLITEDVKRPQRVEMVALSLTGVALVQVGAKKLRGGIDRRFFREAYEADQILSDLADEVRTFVETAPLLETLARRIAESLHVSRVAVLIQTGDAFQPAHTLGYTVSPQGPPGPPVRIAERSATAERLRRERHVLVYPEDDSSWIYGAAITDDERDALRRLDSQLLLPLALNQKLLGILSLGPKRSEEPFSKTDLRLLDAVATQTGLALENSRLAAAVTAEVAHRERMNRELEIAREVQERMFPQDCPPIEGLDYAGACRPARGVGGDYYDFIQLTETELGIAIGDVSGKGVPAALLMAGLRASLRGQTIRREDDLAQLMATVNQLVYESSSSNRYATFFYSQYDAASRRLAYVNGGHNPPMILRKGSDIIRLQAGGPAVGLLPGCSYEQGVVQLQCGDVFLAFTDGISEAMNAEDQEWGEDRLLACATRLNGCAREGIAQIMAAADEFVAGAPQYDDMTIVLAYVR